MIIINFAFCLHYVILEFEAAHTKEVRIQCFYLAGMLLATVGGYLFFLSGKTYGYDTTMAGAFIGAILLTVLFLRYKLFDSLTMAKDRAMDYSATGFMVIRTDGGVEYANYTAETILKEALTLDSLRHLPQGTRSISGRDSRIYEIAKNPVNQKDRIYGETLEIRDITEKHRNALRLEEMVDSRTREIKKIQRTVIASLAGAIDARDSSTGTHIRNIGRYAEIIARAMHELGLDGGVLTEDYITCLVDVAPLHDIGKVSIPDSILMKPRKLSDKEYDLIKTHAAQGGKIITECLGGVETEEYVKMAREVACYHHERWDGKGYPEGRSGTDIPLSARIMSVADVYDAISTERTYKPSFTKEQCRNMIVEGSGTQFDPSVVEAFLHAVSLIEAIADEIR